MMIRSDYIKLNSTPISHFSLRTIIPSNFHPSQLLFIYPLQPSFPREKEKKEYTQKQQEEIRSLTPHTHTQKEPQPHSKAVHSRSSAVCPFPVSDAIHIYIDIHPPPLDPYVKVTEQTNKHTDRPDRCRNECSPIKDASKMQDADLPTLLLVRSFGHRKKKRKPKPKPC